MIDAEKRWSMDNVIFIANCKSISPREMLRWIFFRWAYQVGKINDNADRSDNTKQTVGQLE